MPGIPLWFGPDNGGTGMPTVRISTFVRIDTLLTHDTALVDVHAGTIGYFRLTWSAEAFFVAEYSFRGTSMVLFLCPGGYTPAVNNWHWVSAICGGSGDGGGAIHLFGQTWGPGVTPGLQQHIVGDAPALTDLVDCGLGWGVPLSSTYNPFPFADTDLFAELCVETWNGPYARDTSVRPVPSAPIVAPTTTTSTGIVALYHPSEALATGITIHDATPNHYDLVPGPNNDQVLAASPFG